ncbi:MAG: cytochrome c peroxidase [Acidimicrobiia bacterium]|nr:cytochrome c peroxidase [Acidimicrobiia bacterium]
MRPRVWGLLFMAILLVAAVVPAGAQELTPIEQLGEGIFFDEALSINGNQSCASCHDPDWGWTGPNEAINAAGAVYEGSIAGRFGDRKPPSSAYATVSPIFHVDKKGTYVGGNFWDGRATGEKLGNPAADQAQGPFLNPMEQALPDSACVVWKVCTGGYGTLFTSVWGADTCSITWPGGIAATCATEGTTVALSAADRTISDGAYDQIALAIAAFEDSTASNAFSSKFDLGKLSREEQRGFALFQGKGGCRACHSATGQDALFTDFTFDNLGIPVNPENPAYLADPDFRDPGLGGFLMNAGYDEDVYEEEMGKFKVPTLRNVALQPAGTVKAFGHNGYFKSLEGIVHFYNTRDVKPECPGAYTEAQAMSAGCWPAPEIDDNVNTDELGDLGLTPAEEAAIVAFLRTLSDG